MKKLLVVFFVVFCSLSCLAQTKETNNLNSLLQGIWESEDEGGSYMLFDNGTYEFVDDMGMNFTLGTFRIVGNSIVMTPVMYKSLIRKPYGGGFVEEIDYEDEPESSSYDIDVQRYTIEGMMRKEFDSFMTREEFFKLKASVKTVLKK